MPSSPRRRGPRCWIPHELNALWCRNRASTAKLLFATAHEVLYELPGDPKYLGAMPALLTADPQDSAPRARRDS